MRKILFLCLLSLTSIVTVGQVRYNYRYWFDGKDDASRTGVSSTNKWNINADVSELDVGFHTLYVQVDTSGVQSPVLMKYFFKPSSNDVVIRYWFDNGYTNSKELNSSIVDVSHLRDGLHSISFMVNDNGVTSAVKTTWFIKVANPTSGKDVTCVCLIDGVEYAKEKVAAKGGILKFDFDVRSLPQGLHKIQVFCVTPSGTMTNMKESMFLRATTEEEVQSMKCYYAIDGSAHTGYMQAGTYSDGMFHFDLDVANLNDGVHSLTYMLVSESGVATRAGRTFFIKTPVGGNQITKWEYWLNGNDAIKHTNILDVPKNPLQVITLLPVESCPIRSSCFEFRVEDKKPVLYAKNDINFRFYDKAGRITDVSRQYVDESVRQELNQDEMSVLQSGVTTRINRPGENKIEWYKFDAEEGELAEFNSNKACAIDIFTPSGELFYSVSGAESVKNGGGNLPETGTYYVAVHDMTAKTGTYLDLTFKLIDKYAVLSNTPNISANAGYLFVDIYGNGMNHLDSVQMVSSEVIASTTYFNVINNNLSKMLFELTEDGLPKGKYDLMLYFADSLKNERDTLLVSNAIELVAPKSGEITVKVDQDYLWVSPYPVTIKIKNTGNTTYWGVPFCIAYNNPDNVANIKYENFAVLWSERALAIDDEHIYRVDSLLGSNDEGIYLPLIIGKLGPYEELNLDLGFLLEDDVPFSLRAWCGTPWSEEKERTVRNLLRAYCPPNVISGQGSDYPSAYDVLDAVDEILPDGNVANAALGVSRLAVGTGETIGSIEIALMHQQRQAEREAYGSAYDEYVAPYRAELPPIRHPLDILMDALGIDNPVEDIPIDFSEYGRCGNNDRPETMIDPARPCEPNEMHGYTSESGSKFINEKVTDVFYSIESENDPEIATAAAHTIIVTDTIDGRCHDLSTFAATKVTLGDVVMDLDGEKEFVRTMDLRPRIDVIAQVELKYDEKSGIAQWTVTSLGPMTMEPTQDVMQGALPVNDSEGNGIGFFNYDIRLKSGLPDGTEIKNRASIIFDIEEPIITPYWTNIVDGVCPESRVTDVTYKNDSIVTLSIEGRDERSGIWKYDLYVQYGVGAPWIKETELAADSTEVDFRIYDGLYYGFCALATDSAGNVEQKQLQPEALCAEIHLGDVNSDGVVNERDAQLTMDYYLEKPVAILAAAADMNEDGVVNTLDVTLIVQMYMNAENATESAPIIKQYYTIRR